MTRRAFGTGDAKSFSNPTFSMVTPRYTARMQDAKRNQLCPCGSGRKFKRCCKPKGAKRSAVSGMANNGTHLRFTVTLLAADPPVWRQFALRKDASFFDLHSAIQGCGWTNSHLWGFAAAGRGGMKAIAGVPLDDGIGEPDPDARDVPIVAHFSKVGDECLYVYDFGDNWEHRVVLEGIERLDKELERVLLAGEGVFPPEDCGGPPGFDRMSELRRTGNDPWDDVESLQRWIDAVDPHEFNFDRARLAFELFQLEAPPSDAPISSGTGATPFDSLKLATQVTPELLDAVGLRLNEAFEEIALEFGIHMGFRRQSYCAVNAKLNVEMAVIRSDGVVMNKEAVDFLLRCGEFGLEEEDLGSIVTSENDVFRVVGLSPRARQPVICERVSQSLTDDKRIRISVDYLRHHGLPRSGGHSLRLVDP